MYSTVGPNATAQCLMHLTINQAEYYAQLDAVYRLYFGWIPLPATVFGLLLTFLYIGIIASEICKRRISRKFYFLLLNKSIGDGICSCLAVGTAIYTLTASTIRFSYVNFYISTITYTFSLICLLMVILLLRGHLESFVEVRIKYKFDSIVLVNSINMLTMAIMETFFTASFWSATVSFVLIGMLKLFAVWKPLQYKQRFTMKRCIRGIIFSWLVFCVMAFTATFVHALVHIPALKRWSSCRIETCLKTLYLVRNSFVILTYIVTVITYLIIVLMLPRIYRPEQCSKKAKNKSSRFPLWKLSLNVGTFAFLNFFYVVWSIDILTQNDYCNILLNLPKMMQILGLIRVALLLRILVDPLIGFVVDEHVSFFFQISSEDFYFQKFVQFSQNQSEIHNLELSKLHNLLTRIFTTSFSLCTRICNHGGHKFENAKR
uniref:G_PROTEIN_RECEP_F1_2 domain-containing protein n=1 Tax=Syphacia muris TaxID=451379 RepID=A0A0N5AHK7_9BILA